jgi:hypothetical protein
MKRAFTVVLCFVLFHTILVADAMALAPGAPPSKQAVKVAAAVARLGSGEGALVALRLQNKSVLKGRVAAIAADSFLVTDNETGAEQRVGYAQVARLQGVNLLSGTHVQVGGGFKARVVSVARLLLPVHQVQKNSLTSGEKTLLIGIVVGILLAIILAKTL